MFELSNTDWRFPVASHWGYISKSSMIISPMVLIFAGGIIGGSMAARPAHAAEANNNATKLNRSPFVGKQKS